MDQRMKMGLTLVIQECTFWMEIQQGRTVLIETLTLTHIDASVHGGRARRAGSVGPAGLPLQREVGPPGSAEIGL